MQSSHTDTNARAHIERVHAAAVPAPAPPRSPAPEIVVKLNLTLAVALQVATNAVLNELKVRVWEAHIITSLLAADSAQSSCSPGALLVAGHSIVCVLARRHADDRGNNCRYLLFAQRTPRELPNRVCGYRSTFLTSPAGRQRAPPDRRRWRRRGRRRSRRDPDPVPGGRVAHALRQDPGCGRRVPQGARRAAPKLL